MRRTVTPAPLQGTLRVLPSKSASHRAVLAASLAQGACDVAPLQLSEDIRATIRCAQALGLLEKSEITPLGGAQEGFVSARFAGGGARRASGGVREADCGESGSTLRFFMPLALDGRGAVRFTGQGRLMERPQEVYRELFAQMGAVWQDAPGQIVLRGRLRGGDWPLRGDVSSQFITGLLYALPLCEEDSTLTLLTALESSAYVTLTRRMLARFGVTSEWRDERTLFIPGGQHYESPGSVSVEGDWSHAAFYLVAGRDRPGRRGRAADGAFARLRTGRQGRGGRAEKHGREGVLGGGRAVRLPLGAARRHHRRRANSRPRARAVRGCLRRAGRNAHRERGAAAHQGMRPAGRDAKRAFKARRGRGGAADGLVVRGGRRLHGAAVDAWNDHRIAMALCVVSALCKGEMTLSGAESVKKSAPAFYREFESLGGMTHALDLGK